MKSLSRITQAHVQLSTSRPVRLQRLCVHDPVPPHDHDYHEVCIVTAGRCRHRSDEADDDFGQGNVVVMPPGAVHAFEKPRGLEVINIYYLAEWLSNDPGLLWSEAGVVPLFCSQSLIRIADSGAEVFHLDTPALAAADRELTDMEIELARPIPGPLVLKSCFLKLIAGLTRAWNARLSATATARFRPEVWQTMRRIERCINGGQVFTLARAAADAGWSADHLSAEFHAAIGYSPVQYFQRRRVQRACQLLADLRLSMTEISQQLGYADAPHFCRQFRKHQGMSPRAYRQTYAP